MKKFQEKLFDSSSEGVDNDILENDNLSNDVGLLASKNIVDKRIDYKDGRFTIRKDDESEEDVKKDFWTKVSDDIRKPRTTSEVAMKQFLIFFDNKGFSGQKENIVRAIKAAAYYKNR